MSRDRDIYLEDIRTINLTLQRFIVITTFTPVCLFVFYQIWILQFMLRFEYLLSSFRFPVISIITRCVFLWRFFFCRTNIFRLKLTSIKKISLSLFPPLSLSLSPPPPPLSLSSSLSFSLPPPPMMVGSRSVNDSLQRHCRLSPHPIPSLSAPGPTFNQSSRRRPKNLRPWSKRRNQNNRSHVDLLDTSGQKADLWYRNEIPLVHGESNGVAGFDRYPQRETLSFSAPLFSNFKVDASSKWYASNGCSHCKCKLTLEIFSTVSCFRRVR